MTVTTLSGSEPRHIEIAPAKTTLFRALGRLSLLVLGLMIGAMLGLFVALATGLMPFVC